MRMRTLRRAPLLLLLTGLAMGAFSITFTHLAGSVGGPGFEDATGTASRFNAAVGVAVDGSGNVYVADTGNHTIRKISGGIVTTFAGLAETSGQNNGHGAYARFSSPKGVAVDAGGNVYVADTANHAIRKITPAGVVSYLAGTPGTAGFVNATGFSARFSSPTGVTVDSSGNVYVADTGNHAIRKITPGGEVTTVAGTGSAGNSNNPGLASFSSPTGVVWDAVSAALYVADGGNRVIRKITLPGPVVTTFAGTMNTAGHQDGTPGRFYTPAGIAVDAGGAFYVADSGDHTIRSITSGGSVGSVTGLANYPGPEDGVGLAARFQTPKGIAVTGTTLYVADTGNNTIRSVAVASNTTSTYAGLANASGFTNATGDAARFNKPTGISFYPGPPAYAFVADTNNHAIRMVTTDGIVTTIAGGTFGYQNGNGPNAWFKFPQGVALGVDYLTAYVADTGNHCIRYIDASGNVTLFAGQPGVPGSANGDRLTAASFNNPIAVKLNATQDALYVVDRLSAVRKIDLASGAVTTVFLLGGVYADITDGTTGLMLDSSNNVFIAGSGKVLKHAGSLTTFAGNFGDGPLDGTGTAARFAYPGPRAIAYDSFAGSGAYVLDGLANQIRHVNLTTAAVTTIGGKLTPPAFPYQTGDWYRHPNNGTSDGTGTFARFNYPHSLDSAAYNMVITEGHTIRYGVTELADRAVIDSANGLVGTTRQLDTSPQTATSWTWSIIRRPSGSTAELSATNVRNPTFTPDVPDLYVFRCKAVSAAGTSISTVSLQGNGATTNLTVAYPGPVTAGVPFNITVTARDQYGSVGDGYTGTIHFTSSDPDATLPADYTYTLGDHGSHIFSITLRTAGASRSITATDMSNGAIYGLAFADVAPAAASSLVLDAPDTANTNTPFDITLTAMDAFDNVATGYRGTVHFTSSDGAATLPSNYTFTAGDNGVHTFGSVELTQTGTQSITVTDIADGALTDTENVSMSVGTPGAFSARATDTSAVLVVWTPPSGATGVEVWKLSAGGMWTLVTTSGGTSYNDTAVVANAAYAYKLRTIGTGGQMSDFTPVDVATTIVYTDDPLLASTPIRAVHYNEVRTAVNLIRTLAGLAPGTFTDTLTSSTPIRALHTIQARAWLDEARAALGAPALVHTDPSLPLGTPVKYIHFFVLREGVR